MRSYRFSSVCCIRPLGVLITLALSVRSPYCEFKTPLFASQEMTEGVDSVVVSLIRQSWETHPDLQTMGEMVSADSARSVMLKGWMNPMLSLGIMDLPLSGKLHQMEETAFRFGVIQKVPFPGKLKVAGEWGDAASRLSFYRWQSARYQMARMVAMNYFEFLSALGTLHVLMEGDSLNRVMMEAARVMLASGMGSLSDYQRARLEAELWEVKIRHQELIVNQKRSALIYALGGRDLSAEIPTALAQLTLPPPLSLDSLLQPQVIDSTPEVKEAYAQLEWAMKGLNRAKKEYYPDLEVMANYNWRTYITAPSGSAPMADGEAGLVRKKLDDMIGLEASFSIPLFYRRNQQAQVAEMRAMVREAQQRLEDARLLKQKQMREYYYCCGQYEVARTAKTQLYEAAMSLWESRLIDYQNNKVDLMSLQEARMQLTMTKMEIVMRVYDAWMTRWSVLTALGHPGD